VLSSLYCHQPGWLLSADWHVRGGCAGHARACGNGRRSFPAQHVPLLAPTLQTQLGRQGPSGQTITNYLIATLRRFISRGTYRYAASDKCGAITFTKHMSESSSSYPSSHSINAIGPAPLRSGNKREHCSIMFATIAHIPSLDKILSNAPRYHSTHTSTTPNIIRNKAQQLGGCISQ
jgi:hypothetical protein